MLFKTSSLYVHSFSFRFFKNLIRERCLQIRFLCDESRDLTRSLRKITDDWITKLRQGGIDDPELSVKYIIEKVLAKVGLQRYADNDVMIDG